MKSNVHRLYSESESVDFAIITTLQEEWEAVRKRLDNFKKIEKTIDDTRTYYSANVLRPQTKELYEIIVASPISMGQSSAVSVTKDVIQKFSPQNIILLGIAAGTNEKKCKLGDVILARIIIDYSKSKISDAKEKFRPEPYRVGFKLLESAEVYRRECEARTYTERWQDKISIKQPAGKLQTPKCHIGSIASGNSVVAWEQYRNGIVERLGFHDLYAIEMEGGGFSLAIYESGRPIGVLVIRGLCDWADKNKDDDWHIYAADSAAAFLFGFLKTIPVTPLCRYKMSQKGSIQSSKRTGTLLPEGPLRILLAMGIPQSGTNIKLCDEYIYRIAHLMSKRAYRLIYSGTDGGNLATKLCRELTNISRNLKERIYSFIAEEYENPSLFPILPISKKELAWHSPIGNEIRYAGMSREIRRQKMVDECDFCLVMAGERIVLQIVELCKLMKKPMLPLYFSGGVAHNIFSSPEKLASCKELIVESCGNKGWQLFTEINSEQSTIEEKAMRTIELIDLFEKIK